MQDSKNTDKTNKIMKIFDDSILEESLARLANYIRVEKFTYEKSNASTLPADTSEKDWIALNQIISDKLLYTSRIFYNHSDASTIMKIRFKDKQESEVIYGDLFRECSNILVGSVKNILVANNVSAKLCLPLVIKKNMDITFHKTSVFQYRQRFIVNEGRFHLGYEHELNVMDQALVEALSQVQVGSVGTVDSKQAKLEFL